MLAKVLADYLEANVPSLVQGKSLFIEKSIGKCVAISVPSTYDFNVNNTVLKAYCTIGVMEYSMEEGYSLAGTISDLIFNIHGELPYVYDGITATYKIYNAKIVNYPYFTSQDDRNIYYLSFYTNYLIKKGVI